MYSTVLHCAGRRMIEPWTLFLRSDPFLHFVFSHGEHFEAEADEAIAETFRETASGPKGPFAPRKVQQLPWSGSSTD